MMDNIDFLLKITVYRHIATVHLNSIENLIEIKYKSLEVKNSKLLFIQEGERKCKK